MGLLDKIVNVFGKGGNLLYYPGCLTRYKIPDVMERYKKILDSLGIEYIMVEDFHCCGSPPLNAGYADDYRNLREYNLKKLKDYGVGKVVSNCPTCFSIFKSLYGVNTTHMTLMLLEHVDKLEPVKENVKVTFHDPCHLGRYEGIFDPPRELIEQLGYEIVEMEHTREKSVCCGAGGGVRSNFDKISRNIALRRVKEAKDTGAEWLVTACPMCYLQLKEAGDKAGLEVKELSHIIKI